MIPAFIWFFVIHTLLTVFTLRQCCFRSRIVDLNEPEIVDYEKDSKEHILYVIQNWRLVQRYKLNREALFSAGTNTMNYYRTKLNITQGTNLHNGERDPIFEKVVNLFDNMYTEMDSIIVGVRTMLLKSMSGDNQSN